MHVSRENAAFIPMKSKDVFRILKQMEGNKILNKKQFLSFLTLSFTLTLDIIIKIRKKQKWSEFRLRQTE